MVNKQQLRLNEWCYLFYSPVTHGAPSSLRGFLFFFLVLFGARCGSRPSADGPDQMRMAYLMQDFLPFHP